MVSHPEKLNMLQTTLPKVQQKGKTLENIYFPHTCISFPGITLFILFDPQTPLPSQAIWEPTFWFLPY
jgi:hypothetical protein